MATKLIFLGAVFAVAVTAAPSPKLKLPWVFEPEPEKVEVKGPYEPYHIICPVPQNEIIRPASGLGEDEAAYLGRRQTQASKHLKDWVSQYFSTALEMPTLALSVSAGGYRSMLTGAGVIQALDKRDSNTPMSGLFQAMTYEVAASGGSWLLASMAAHNNAIISHISDNKWKGTLGSKLIGPDPLPWDRRDYIVELYQEILVDINTKYVEFGVTKTDIWGRLLSHQLLPGPRGGITTTMSGLRKLPAFERSEAPIPILTALSVDVELTDQCYPDQDASAVEMSPFAFGSFGNMPSAFMPTELLGTRPSYATNDVEYECVANFDNLGFLLAASSSQFNLACDGGSPPFKWPQALQSMLYSEWFEANDRNFAQVPNPFYQYKSPTADPAASYKAQPFYAVSPLYLVDGGETNHGVPVLPLLEKARGIDVIFVSDNSADTKANYPDGSQLLAEKYRADANPRLRRRFPRMPTNTEFAAHAGAWFFGCHQPEAATIIYLPNRNYTTNSGTPTSKMLFTHADTDAMIANGGQVGTNGGEEDFGFCVACAIMKKQETTLQKVPENCAPCFKRYCYS